MKRWLAFVPVLLFAALCVLLWRSFSLDDPSRLPSPLINQPFPNFELPTLESTAVLRAEDLQGEVALVNLWATWCPTCYAEHRFLLAITEQYQLPIYGINYKDDPQEAKRWLQKLGNPFRFNILDPHGRLGIELGAYGAPETFIIDAKGIIRYKRVGEVNERIWLQELWPLIQKLRAETRTEPAL